MKNKIKIFLTGFGLLTLFSCDSFLEEKPQKALLIPQTFEDVRGLLDYYSFFRIKPLTLFIAADEWETPSENWATFAPWEQNTYLWQKDRFDPLERSADYINLHGQLNTANTALKILEDLENKNEATHGQLRGDALAIRSGVLIDLAVLFLPSPQSNRSEEVRIPINLSADINAPLQMIGIRDLLDLVKRDLDEAFSLLPDRSEFKTRADKRVVKSLLARIYLYEQNWDEAFKAANFVVANGDGLLEYSEIDSTLFYPFKLFNSETVWFREFQSSGVNAGPATYILPELYDSYQANDLRKVLFFRMSPTQRPVFKGSYTGGFLFFSGISLPELYLTAAEAAIRSGRVEEGLKKLNELGKTRYRAFESWIDLSQEEALQLTLFERRKELVFRGTRWMDMKRFRQLDPSFKATREIYETVYELVDEDQYTMEIPPYEVVLGGR